MIKVKCFSIEILKNCGKNDTNLERFKNKMEPAMQLYARENRDFASNYDALGKMSMREFPDIDTQDYIFDFEKISETSEEELDEIYEENSRHMKEFSKKHGIEKFYINAVILI